MSVILTKLGSNDVLLGRGTGPNDNEGNKNFRVLASELLRTKATSSKYELATELVEKVHARNGQFVRKLTKCEATTVARDMMMSTMAMNNNHHQNNKKKKFWKKSELANMYVVVPRDVALSKAKQSFRHQLRVMETTTPGENEDNNSTDCYTTTRRTTDYHGNNVATTTNGVALEDEMGRNLISSSEKNVDKSGHLESPLKGSSLAAAYYSRSPLRVGATPPSQVGISGVARSSYSPGASPSPASPPKDISSSLRDMLMLTKQQAEASSAALNASILRRRNIELDAILLNSHRHHTNTTTPTSSTSMPSSPSMYRSMMRNKRTPCWDPILGMAPPPASALTAAAWQSLMDTHHSHALLLADEAAMRLLSNDNGSHHHRAGAYHPVDSGLPQRSTSLVSSLSSATNKKASSSSMIPLDPTMMITEGHKNEASPSASSASSIPTMDTAAMETLVYLKNHGASSH